MSFDPRIDKLVEAFKLFIGLVEADSYENNIKISGIKKAQSALKEASTPLKEFAGLKKSQWELAAYLMEAEEDDEDNVKQHMQKISAACRQIADGLSE